MTDEFIDDNEDYRYLNPKLQRNLTVTIVRNDFPIQGRIFTIKESQTENEFINIHEQQNPNPRLQRRFTLIIFGNRVSVTVTKRASVVRQWISRIQSRNRYKVTKGSLVVGLGVQWRPPNTHKVATLQLCVGSQCLIFHICRSNSIPLNLREFVSDENVTFVGVRNHGDAEMLQRDYKLKVKHVLELGYVAGYKGFSMERLASLILGFDGVKKIESVGRSDWDQRELCEEQVQYACVDAYISFEIGKKLNAWKYV
ncbi:Polynucleotidyl transferase, ribonuclease H-like superfamily protein [Thalictrum thalictroides]|uniref:Polynucleotidyl transferase, ribonuclease H-like superfamily protein n=1 Tax=Thalictrum thalictroides TaxID=46969 RepID=A0A7J6WSI4_THATH|nr:Polynucleotidyl transferase, ribonuclease H-like superfamily protein [Thalictrum thalictroides]